MDKLLSSNLDLGIIAGGQLGKMLALAASNWAIRSSILDPDEHSAASTVCNTFFKGDFLNYGDVLNFGRTVDVITLELENVNVEALQQLKKEGKRIIPDPDILAVIKDKGLQKQFYEKHSIPTSPFRLFKNDEEIKKAIDKGTVKFPFVQKTRQAGYDGKGVQIINDSHQTQKLFSAPSLIEKKVSINKEIAIIVARNQSGEIKCFPAVEMEFNDTANLVEQLICPADISDKVEQRAINISCKIVEAFDYVGLLAVELFLDHDGNVIVNEIAPRTHNSGHHTIESTITSQYEQQLRALFNLPLGSTQLKLPSVMINLLGAEGFSGPVKYEGLKESLAIEGVKVHLYGKKSTRPFRKMGHVTILDTSIERAKAKAKKVKSLLKVIS